jgi:hypothetical protein
MFFTDCRQTGPTRSFFNSPRILVYPQPVSFEGSYDPYGERESKETSQTIAERNRWRSRNEYTTGSWNKLTNLDTLDLHTEAARPPATSTISTGRSITSVT